MSTNDQSNTCCTQESSEKLKILAIHGYRQNAQVFKDKTGSFRKLVHKWADFTYVTAPHRVIAVDSLETLHPVDVGPGIENEQYGWWFNREDKTFRGIRNGGPAIGFDVTLKVIEETFEKYGPFDGLLGFSQGGCLVGLLSALQQRGLLKVKFNFVIIAAGFKSKALPHLKYYEDPIEIPSLHIHGETDDIIPKEMGESLRDCFENGIFVSHPGKHYLPASSLQKQDYQDFFKVQLKNKLSVN